MPLEVIEATDPLASMIRFHTSTVCEMIISLQNLVKSTRHASWAASARAELPPRLLDELKALYEPFFDGAIFFELALDAPDQDDVPGFLAHLRRMEPERFLFYTVGRIMSVDEIARLGTDPEPFMDRLREVVKETQCWCAEAPIEWILADVPAFQNRLADLWEWYWDVYFRDHAEELRPHWEHALDDKSSLLARLGGQGLLEHITGKAELPKPLPADIPYTDIAFVPVYLLPPPVYMFYGYGNITIVFDSERTEARSAELARSKDEALAIFKAMADSTRLDILRLIVHSEGRMHGKQIAAKLNMSASAVSRHLAQLKDAGLIVEESQDNRTITYRLQSDAIRGLPDKIMDFLYH